MQLLKSLTQPWTSLIKEQPINHKNKCGQKYYFNLSHFNWGRWKTAWEKDSHSYISVQLTIQSLCLDNDADSNENSEVIFNSFATLGECLKRNSKELESVTEKS